MNGTDGARVSGTFLPAAWISDACSGDQPLVGGGEPSASLALIDDQADSRLAGGEVVVEDVYDLGRFGALGQVGGGVVHRFVRELAAEWHQGRERDHPGEQDQPLGAAAGDDRCECSQVGLLFKRLRGELRPR